MSGGEYGYSAREAIPRDYEYAAIAMRISEQITVSQIQYRML
jgi:hypothetical protein